MPKTKCLGPLWPDTILEPLEGRKLRVGYLSADLGKPPGGAIPTARAQPSQPRAG